MPQVQMSTSSGARGKRSTAKKAKKPAPEDPRRLLQQLERHQAELRVQNEQLLAARVELEQALSRYTELFDFAPIGYAILAGDVIREVNHAGARLLGVHRADLVNARMSMLIAVPDIARFSVMLATAIASEDQASCEIELRQRDRGRRVIRVKGSVQPGAGGMVLIAFDDITERQAEAERLAQTERALRDADRRKDDFLAMLSHELRNPLAPIRTSLFVLGSAEPGSDHARQSLEIIDRQVAHLTRLVDDLLDITRISRGKVQLRRELVDLVELVMNTVADHASVFAAAGVELASTSPPGKVWVEVDPARLIQAISNLLHNAEKFTPRGGRVHVAIEQRATLAVVRVRDTGAGIVSELIPHVFEPFMQAPQTSDRTDGGLGLGLAMVKGFVALHGGDVRLASEGPGRGTEVVLELPLVPQREPVSRAKLPSIRARRVLVIEDHPHAAEGMKLALTMIGHQTAIAADGQSGLQLARTFHPEIVLCDIGLPGMDGYQVARSFRAEACLRDIFLIALSGYAQPEDVERASAAGFDRHVAKPADLETLVRVMSEAPG